MRCSIGLMIGKVHCKAAVIGVLEVGTGIIRQGKVQTRKAGSVQDGAALRTLLDRHRDNGLMTDCKMELLVSWTLVKVIKPGGCR